MEPALLGALGGTVSLLFASQFICTVTAESVNIGDDIAEQVFGGAPSRAFLRSSALVSL